MFLCEEYGWGTYEKCVVGWYVIGARAEDDFVFLKSGKVEGVCLGRDGGLL